MLYPFFSLMRDPLSITGAFYRNETITVAMIAGSPVDRAPIYDVFFLFSYLMNTKKDNRHNDNI
jgi:hypothetical protein